MPKIPDSHLKGVKLNNLVYFSLGDYLRDIREQAGLSRGQVAKRLGHASPQYSIVPWEFNRRPVAMKYIKKLARYYGRPNSEIRKMIVKFEIIKIKQKWGFK